MSRIFAGKRVGKRMKKYIILSYTICGMGGGQMYQFNKLRYMKEQGYDTYLFYCKEDKLVLTDIINYCKLKCIKEFDVNPSYLSSNKRKNVLNEFERYIGSISEDSIIESCNLNSSLWGELISKKHNCVSYIYIIDEKIGKLDKSTFNYLKFKRDNNLVKGIKKETYKMVFGEFPDNYDYCLPVVCSNVLIDTYKTLENYEIDESKYDLKICTIGRIDKPYVPTLVNEILIIAKRLNKKKILYCMIGDSPNRDDIQKIKNALGSCSNLHCILLGAIYPIPRNLLYEFDIFISSAGSASLTSRLAIPTISIDAKDYNAIGIMQIETQNSVFRDKEPIESISSKVLFLVNNYDRIKEKLNVVDEFDLDSILTSHIKYISKIVNSKVYFNFCDQGLNFKMIICKALYLVLGYDWFCRIRQIRFDKNFKTQKERW